MKTRIASLGGLAAALLLAPAVAPAVAPAAVCKMKPKKLDSGQRRNMAGSPNVDWLFSITDGQTSYIQFRPTTVTKDGKKQTTWSPIGDDGRLRDFNRIVKKQPEKYNAEHPMRSVVKFGDKQYAFVFDAAEPKGQGGYGLLYFDVNANGDLTDDDVIESTQAKQAREAREKAEKEKAEKAAAEGKDATDKEKKDEKKDNEKEKARRELAAYYARSVNHHQFPAVELKIEVDGKPADYRVFAMIQSYFMGNYGQVHVSFTPGLCYEGEIELDGRRQRVVLVDRDSNGRFDDRTKIIEARMSPSGPARLYPQNGDVLYLDPKPVQDPNAIWDATGLSFRHNVEKLICLGDRYYDLKVDPSGSELSIEPSDVALGYVKNPNAEYSVMIHGDAGLITINGQGDKPVPVPEGEWKMVSYKIDLTKLREAEAKKKEEEAKKAAEEEAKEGANEETKNDTAKTGEKKSSLWDAIGKAVNKAAGTNRARAVRRQGPKTTLVSAMGTTAGKPIKVVKDETVLLPFGPPYKPVVEPSYFQSNNDTLSLGLEIQGSVGEQVTNLMVDGDRPEKPKFKILGPEDKVVQQGNFEYG